jgi:replicative DNA helicase
MCSPEAEQELVSAPFVDPACLERIAEVVSPEDFLVWGALHVAQLVVYRQSQTLDYPLLVTELQRRGMDQMEAHRVCGAALDRSGTTANVEHYAQVVRDRAVLRRLAGVGEWISQAAHQLPDDVEGFACRAESRVREVAEQGSRWGLHGAEDVATRTLERIYAAKAGDESVLGLQTGFAKLDKLTGGLPDGVSFVAARPECGKSAFCLDVVLDVAQRGHGVFVWSAEMPEWDIATRLMGKLSGFCVQDMLNRAEVDTNTMRRIQDAGATVSTLPLFVDCEPGLTADQVTLRARRAQRELRKAGKELRLVVVDHFHRLNHGPGDRPDEMMRRASNHFADWAKKQALPLLVAAQLNRVAEHRRPEMSHLRECGAAEQDAEIMLGIWHPWKAPGAVAQPHNVAEVVLMKNRRGTSKVVLKLHFDGPCMRFREMDG